MIAEQAGGLKRADVDRVRTQGWLDDGKINGVERTALHVLLAKGWVIWGVDIYLPAIWKPPQ